MKHLILLVALLFSASAYTQSDIQIVKIKHDERSVSVYAVNNSEITYAVNVNVSLRGMKLEAPIKKSIKVTPGVDVLVAKLIPTASETHYKVNFQATAMERGKADLLESCRDGS